MALRWYVVHVYSGSEKKVAEAIRDQIVRKGMQDFWNSIDNNRKLDITKYAHWTGTGLVWYGDKIPSINLN